MGWILAQNATGGRNVPLFDLPFVLRLPTGVSYFFIFLSCFYGFIFQPEYLEQRIENTRICADISRIDGAFYAASGVISKTQPHIILFPFSLSSCDFLVSDILISFPRIILYKYPENRLKMQRRADVTCACSVTYPFAFESFQACKKTYKRAGQVTIL